MHHHTFANLRKAREAMNALVCSQCHQAFELKQRGQRTHNPYPAGSPEYTTWQNEWARLTRRSVDHARTNVERYKVAAGAVQ